MPEESKGTDVGAGSQSKESGTATKKQGQAGKVFAPRAPKFEGRCVDLKGHIYDCSDVRQSDQYTKTTKEIAEYVGRTYKYGGDTRLAIENDLTLPTFTPPQRTMLTTQAAVRFAFGRNSSTNMSEEFPTLARTSRPCTPLCGANVAI